MAQVVPLNRAAHKDDAILDIPLKNIKVVNDPNAYARAALDDDRVKEMSALIKDNGMLADKSGAPVYAIVGQVPDQNDKYWLLDGRHLYFAHEMAGLKTIKAMPDPDFHIASMNAEEITKAVLYSSARLNWGHSGVSLTPKERRNTVKKLYTIYRYTIEQLLVLGSKASVYRWLGEDLEKPMPNTAEKQEAFRMLDEGLPQTKVAEILEVSQPTISTWQKDRQNTAGFTPKSDKPGNTVPASGTKPGIGAIKSTTIKKSQAALTKICETLRQLSWHEDLDTDVLNLLIPMLQKKSDKLSAILRDGHLSTELSILTKDNNKLREELVILTRQLAAKKADNQETQKKLQKKLSCDKACLLLNRGMRDIFERDMTGFCADAVQHLELYTAIAAAQKALNDGEYKEAAKLIEALMTAGTGLAATITRTAVRRIASTLEWGKMKVLLIDSDKDFINKFETKIKKNEGEFNGPVAAAIKAVRCSQRLFSEE